MPRGYGENVRRKVEERYKAGESGTDIAKDPDMPGKETVYKILKERNVTLDRAQRVAAKQRKHDEDEQATIVRRYRSGEGATSIAKDFDTTAATIYDILERHGVDTREPGHSNRKLADDEWRDLARRYDAGEAAKSLAEEVGVNKTTLYRHLHRLDIPLHQDPEEHYLSDEEKRLIVQAYDRGKGLKDVAEVFGRHHSTVWRLVRDHPEVEMREMGVARREHDVDLSFFEDVNDEETAYVVGLLTADGWVTSFGDKWGIELDSADWQHLEWVRGLVGYHGPIYLRDRRDEVHYIRGREVNGGISGTLDVASRKMVSDLKALGFDANKSFTAKPIDLPESIERHYWRGVFDGDGSIGRGNSHAWLHVNGTRAICQGFAGWVEEQTGIVREPYERDVEGTRDDHRVQYQRPEVASVVQALYEDATICLHRKLVIADTFK